MRRVSDFREIYLHRLPVDGRKGINGLSMIVEDAMGQAPFGGGLFAFTSRRKDTIKLLYWDKSGFALWVKQLQQEKFKWPVKFAGETVSLSSEQLSWLLDGYDITKMKPHQTLSYTRVA